jgi:hypothetical protein
MTAYILTCTAQDFHPENGKKVFPRDVITFRLHCLTTRKIYTFLHIENIKNHMSLGRLQAVRHLLTGEFEIHWGHGWLYRKMDNSFDTGGNIECQLTFAPFCVFSSTLHRFRPVTGQPPDPCRVKCLATDYTYQKTGANQPFRYVI